MGAIISLELRKSVILLTDAAKYTIDGTVREFGSMVHTAKHASLAVTFRGPTYGAQIAEAICKMADQIGVVAAFNLLQDTIDANLDVLRHDLFTGRNWMTFFVAAYIPEKRKAFHVCFRTDDKPRDQRSLMCEMPKDFSLTCRGQQLYQVWRPEWYVCCGPRHSEDELFTRKLSEKTNETTWIDWCRQEGGKVMELMRRTPRSIPAALNEVPVSTVGGWCDMTIIDADGVRTERLRQWPDQAGEKIKTIFETATFRDDSAAPV